MRKFVLIIIGLICAAIFILGGLIFIVNSGRNQKNGFQRRFIQNVFTKIDTATFENNFRDICGINNDRIYLSDQVPGRISTTNLNLNSLDTLYLRIPSIPKLSPVFYTWVNFPNIYILGGNLRAIIRGNLLTHTYETKFIATGPFAKGIAINHENFIMRSIDTVTKQSLFKKVNLKENVIQVEHNISEKNTDAGFSYDGTLSYDPLTHRLLYVCYYCNLFICFDSNLNLNYKKHTIDTTYSPRVEIMKTKYSITHELPPVTINANSSSYGGTLFIQSELKADNEIYNSIKGRVVIDMYDEYSGLYKSSFYLPLINGEKFKKFQVIQKNQLIAFYEKAVVKYKLNIQ